MSLNIQKKCEDSAKGAEHFCMKSPYVIDLMLHCSLTLQHLFLTNSNILLRNQKITTKSGNQVHGYHEIPKHLPTVTKYTVNAFQQKNPAHQDEFVYQLSVFPESASVCNSSSLSLTFMSLTLENYRPVISLYAFQIGLV